MNSVLSQTREQCTFSWYFLDIKRGTLGTKLIFTHIGQAKLFSEEKSGLGKTRGIGINLKNSRYHAAHGEYRNGKLH